MSAQKASVQNLILYGLFALFAAWVFSLTADFPQPLLPGYPGSAMFPRFAVVLMGVLSLIGIAREVLRLFSARAGAVPVPAEGEPDASLNVRDVVLSCLALAAFAVALEYLGMEVAVFGFCAAMTYVATRHVVASLVSGVGSVAVVYIVFVQGLSVFLPLTFLPRHIAW
ncbi:tripartite tricarboxylate transporter TctB family protein [Starkeya koreensis]|uniref:Tripartite tricarboxylate transporter TctB family protein n=1 Tax=Ancylobacter koreensis TaxID=266121 RepID=A0ABT0DRA6_9HYPH|nr:tripartite tricarboxylate transporter TctB family protein [Ancylobacter koreensis]MCK0209724.1 tripartite tricarboxylate transporter TctB family protein [Ancylobacter koreensis]